MSDSECAFNWTRQSPRNFHFPQNQKLKRKRRNKTTNSTQIFPKHSQETGKISRNMKTFCHYTSILCWTQNVKSENVEYLDHAMSLLFIFVSFEKIDETNRDYFEDTIPHTRANLIFLWSSEIRWGMRMQSAIFAYSSSKCQSIWQMNNDDNLNKWHLATFGVSHTLFSDCHSVACSLFFRIPCRLSAPPTVWPLKPLKDFVIAFLSGT